MEISGKVVMISGASEGIGAACAREFASRGAQLSLMARSSAKLAAVAGNSMLTVAGDLTKAADRERWVNETTARFGRIDILINNAGVGLYQPSHTADMADVRALWELNFFAPLALIQLVAPGMRARKSGMLVNVGSIAGKVTLPWLTLYSASKYALGSLTDGLRMELSRDGVHTMAVCPGYVSTKFQEHILAGEVPAAVRSGKWFRISAERCARDIADGVARNARTVVTPRSGWAFILAERLLPGLVDRRMAALLHRGVGG